MFNWLNLIIGILVLATPFIFGLNEANQPVGLLWTLVALGALVIVFSFFAILSKKR